MAYIETGKKLALAVSAAALLLAFPHYGHSGMASAEPAAVTLHHPYYAPAQLPVVKPAWTAAVAMPAANLAYPGVTAAAENGRVFVLQKNGRLAALRASDGKKLWEYGSALAQRFVYSEGWIYGMTAAGSLYSVSENGKAGWSSNLSLKDAETITVSGNTVYVTQGTRMAAVDCASGRVQWRVAEDPSVYYGGSEVFAEGGVLVRGFSVSGAITVPHIAVYDPATGKMLWENSRQELPLAVRDGLLYSVADTFMMDDDPVNRKIELKAFNARTGELKGTRIYRWKDNSRTDGTFQSGGIHSSAMLEGNDLYLFQGFRLAKYDFDKYKEGAEPVQKWNQESYQERYPLYAIHEGRMFYGETRTGGLSAMKLANGQRVQFDQGGNPTAEAAVFANGVYVGQTDGLFLAYNLRTGSPLFSLQTGSRQFAPILKTGSMVLIRSGGRLLAVKAPASLLQ